MQQLNDKIQPLIVDDIINDIQDNIQFVLLGESTHGTKEFYELRKDITKQLIKHKKFNIILVESDWNNLYRVNRYISKFYNSNDTTPIQSLQDIKHFPLWTYRNNVIVNLIKFLKEWNNQQTIENQVYFLGIDCYQFFQSYKWIIQFLKIIDIDFYNKIKDSIKFIEKFNDIQSYITFIIKNNKMEYIQSLYDKILSIITWDKFDNYIQKCQQLKIDKFNVVSLEQNIEIIINSTEYFLKNYLEPPGSNSSWACRDSHWLTTCMRLIDKMPSVNNRNNNKIIIWAHNSHIGNALHTDKGGIDFKKNELFNIGQYIKSVYPPENSLLIGFLTHNGSVTASTQWDYPSCKFIINDSIQDSIENLFHQICQNTKKKSFYLDFKKYKNILTQIIYQRYIGVIYNPQNELQSHYSKSIISKQYDSIIFIDKTHELDYLV
tara:strand:+ start:10314 stop:11615 length:1302 start_codon:yes stop_codon:yes gene_type:complete